MLPLRFTRYPLATLWLATALVRAQGPPGTIQGIIRDANGRQPLANVAVVVTPDRGQKGSIIPFQGFAITKADGSYFIRNVPPGQYVVCPQVPQSDVLNPCQWSPVEPSVRVTASGPLASAVQDVTLDRGTFIYFQVEDPQGLLETNEGKTPGDGFRLGIVSPRGEYSPASPPMRATKRRLYRALVPKTGPYTPVLDAPRYQLRHGPFGATPAADPFGKPDDLKAGNSQKVHVLNVIGVTPGKL